jgi:hypothetical protein
MSRVHAPLLALNRGECSKSALVRVDVDKMRMAAEQQVNWAPTVMGSMMLRPGTQYLFSTRSDAAALGIPFIYGTNDTAILELTDGHLRVIKSDALLTRASVSTTVTNGDFSSGTGWTLAATSGCTADINSTLAGHLYLSAPARGGVASCLRSVTVDAADQAKLHAFYIVVSKGPVTFMCGTTSGGAELIKRQVLDSGLHSLTCTPGTGTIYVKFETATRRIVNINSITVEAAGTFDLTAPWAAADLSKIRYHQSGDVVFIACDGYQPQKIERRANDSWSLVTYESDDGPFTSSGTQTVTLTSSTYEGAGTLTASAPLFRSTDAGKLFRIFSSGQTYQAVLGAEGATTGSLRVTGVGTGDRNFSWVLAGTWAGTVALERSAEGPDTGFKEVSTQTANNTYNVVAVAADDNIVFWYRIRFKTYTSGAVTASFASATSGGFGPPATGGASATSGATAIVRVVSYSSATVVNIEVLSPFSSISASSAWDHGEWSAADGWPTEVRFFEGRLFWFRGDKYWGSVSDAYYSFDSTIEGDSASINRSFGAGPIDRINFALDLTRLVVGREGSIDTVRSSSQDEPLTPTNTVSRTISTKGADNLPGLKTGLRGVFVDKSSRRVYQLAYSAEAGDYTLYDLTNLNTEIGRPTFTATAVQEQPETYLHFLTAYGQDAVLLHDSADEVSCWWRIQTLGVIERVVVLPGSIEDTVYYIVKRTINGSTKRYWEKTALRSACQGGSLNSNADCFLSVSQASSTTISGLSHLEGCSVVVWANGKDLGSYTVSSAAITVSEAVTTAIVGLGGISYSRDESTAAATLTCSTAYNGYPAEVYANGPLGGPMRYVGPLQVSSGIVTLPNGRTAKKITAYLGFYAPFRSAKLAYGAQMGTALNQSKKVEKVGVILHDTHYQGLKYGSEIDNLQPLPTVAGGQDISSDTVFTEHEEPMVGLSGTWTTDSRLHLLAQAPKPCTVAGVVVAVNTSESR